MILELTGRRNEILAVVMMFCLSLVLIGCGEKADRALRPLPGTSSIGLPTDGTSGEEEATNTPPRSVFLGDYNQPPKVRITIPHKIPGITNIASPHVYVEWLGNDPDGDLAGVSYKYLAIPENQIAGGKWPPAPGTLPPWLPPLSHDSSGVGNGAPPIGYWSEWIPSDSTCVSDFDLSGYVGQKMVVFVTARDEEGAILTENLYSSYNQDNNWVRLSIVTHGPGVQTVVSAGMLGSRRSTNSSEYLQLVAHAFQGTEIMFKFWATEDRALGKLAHAYRYYFDDPDDPLLSTWGTWTHVAPLRQEGCSPEWWVKVPADAVPLAPGLGPHIVVVEVQDLNQDVAHCEFRVEVLPGPDAAGQDLIYLIDDDRAKWLETPYVNYEQDNLAFWTDVLSGYTWDRWDTGADFGGVPPGRVGDASTVIWVVDWDVENPETYLTKLSSRLGNYLDSYVSVGGNVIVIGRDPVYATMYWPDGLLTPEHRAQQQSLDFRPRTDGCDPAGIYNFMWEAFGIEKMALGVPAVAFTALSPCEPGWPTVTTGVIPGVPGWPGRIDNAFYITQVRSDIPVHKLYSVIPVDSNGQPVGQPDCGSRLLAVYVPGDGTRGYAAYVGVPPWFFDHNQAKSMIRQLLAEFGEAPAGNP